MLHHLKGAHFSCNGHGCSGGARNLVDTSMFPPSPSTAFSRRAVAGAQRCISPQPQSHFNRTNRQFTQLPAAARAPVLAVSSKTVPGGHFEGKFPGVLGASDSQGVLLRSLGNPTEMHSRMHGQTLTPFFSSPCPVGIQYPMGGGHCPGQIGPGLYVQQSRRSQRQSRDCRTLRQSQRQSQSTL
jgi:hypothetical protein